MDIQSLISEIDISAVSRDIQWMVDNTPYRIAGSEDERKGAAWVVGQMKQAGLEVRDDVFSAYNSFPKTSKLELLAPHHELIDSLPYAHIRSTPPEGAEFELLYLGNGSVQDYDGLDAAGKLVLVEVSYAPPVPEKARIAKQMGAAGIICMNWGNDERVICNRGLKAVWGNPTEETVGNMPDIVGLGVTRTDGLRLKELCQSGAGVRVRATSVAEHAWSPVHQPLGILRGNGKSDQFILVGSHLDAWYPGVTCNATGNATALELCRILARHRDQPDRDIWFCFWTGHEIAEAAGSTWLVDNYWDELNESCVAYVNIDSTGMREATLYEIKASDELYDYTHGIAREVLTEDIRMMALPKIGDQSFFGIGVPSTAQRMSFTEEYIKRGHGVTLGWWNHTDQDSFDKYSPENIEKDLKVLLRLLAGMAGEAVVPYRFERFFSTMGERLAQAIESGQGCMDLAPLRAAFEKTRDAVLGLQARAGEIQTDRQRQSYNRFLLSVSRRLSNVFKTYAGKYQQDSYGYGKLSRPVPLLADLDRLPALEPDSLEYGMVETQLVKNRNRISDGLYAARELAELYTAAIFGAQ
ncbi:M28 family peptidase [Ruminococcaceae bacterium OttesenSCG-928-D13]|nr:M28 family peptidase [Ruminococcaceae bacterium OttesenSCG-928-D13]